MTDSEKLVAAAALPPDLPGGELFLADGALETDASVNGYMTCHW